MLDETIITKAIIDTYTKEFIENLKVDVIIAGAGPSGLVASRFLAEAGLKTIIFERKLSVGGGMPGGGMMFNIIVVQGDAKRILDKYGIKTKEYVPNYFVADAVEAVSKLTAGAIDAGVKIYNLISVEDVKINSQNEITGAVINWTAVDMAKLHVDPMTFESRCLIDATGHDLEVVKKVIKKVNADLKIEGERSMNAEKGEKLLLETTKKVHPGLYVAGMAANAFSGGERMGPIFGGMLLSGEKVANLIIKELNS